MRGSTLIAVKYSHFHTLYQRGVVSRFVFRYPSSSQGRTLCKLEARLLVSTLSFYPNRGRLSTIFQIFQQKKTLSR